MRKPWEDVNGEAVLKCNDCAVLVCTKCLDRVFKVRKCDIKKMKANKLAYQCCDCLMDQMRETKQKKKKKSKKPSKKRKRKN